jgi:hypothetical protein
LLFLFGHFKGRDGVMHRAQFVDYDFVFYGAYNRIDAATDGSEGIDSTALSFGVIENAKAFPITQSGVAVFVVVSEI